MQNFKKSTLERDATRGLLFGFCLRCSRGRWQLFDLFLNTFTVILESESESFRVEHSREQPDRDCFPRALERDERIPR